VRRLHLKLARWLYMRGPLLMSRLRKRWVLFRNPQADIRFTEPVYLGPRFSLHMPDGGTIIAGPGTEFRRGFRAEVGPEGRVEIGSMCVFTYDVVIQCSTEVIIGDHVMFGQASLIVDGNHRFRDLDTPMLQQGYDFRPITIGENAIVTSKCTILNSIGASALIGAGSVVVDPIPAFCLAVGAPARVVSYFGPPEQRPDDLDPEIKSIGGVGGSV